MAYKDILVFLDSTAEAVERVRSALSLAKAHEARLIGVDVSAPPAGKEAESEAAVTRMFHDATREAAPAAIFVPAEKPGEGDFFTHMKRYQRGICVSRHTPARTCLCLPKTRSH